jgi:hypothetical protein
MLSETFTAAKAETFCSLSGYSITMFIETILTSTLHPGRNPPDGSFIIFGALQQEMDMEKKELLTPDAWIRQIVISLVHGSRLVYVAYVTYKVCRHGEW